MRTSTLYLRAPRFPGPGRRHRSDPSHHGPVPAGEVAGDVDVDEPGPPGDVDRRRGLMGSQLDDDRARAGHRSRPRPPAPGGAPAGPPATGPATPPRPRTAGSTRPGRSDPAARSG